MDLINIVIIVTTFVNFLLGVTALAKNKSHPASKSFFAMTMFIVAWSASMVFFRQATSDRQVFFWGYALYLAASFIPITFVFFSFRFSMRKISKKMLVSLVGGFLVIFSMFVWPGALIEQGHLGADGVNTLDFGWASWIYINYFSLFFPLGVYVLLRHYKKVSGVQKQQTLFVILGTLSPIVIASFTNLYPPHFGYFDLNWIGNVSIIFFVTPIAYAIMRHRLFDIRLIATETFSASVVLVFLINVFNSNSQAELLQNIVMLAFVSMFSVLLVRGTLREISALQELSEKKSEFLSIASHQLRTPVTIMKGYLSMMREGSFGKMDEKQLTVVNKAYRTNEEMLGLINDFLNLSRAEKGTLEYLFAKRDMAAIINGIVTGLKPAAEMKKITLNWSRPAESIFAYVDQTKITQVISNFIDNAIKYTPEGGGISVNIEKEGPFDKTIRVYVKDNGIGIKEEEIESIFGSFERGEVGKKINATGTGLGLYVAKMIIEGHNGKIWAESEGEGKGSTFIIELPIKQPKVERSAM